MVEPSNSSFQRYFTSSLLELSGSEAELEEFSAIHEELEDAGATSEEFGTVSAELEDASSKISLLQELSETESEELLAGAGSCCSGPFALEDESGEHAVSAAATATPVKNTPSLFFVSRMF